MGKTITIRRGYDILLQGTPDKKVSDLLVSDLVAIKPTDFRTVTPKLLVAQGDEFQREVMEIACIIVAVIINCNDIRMAQLGGVASLAAESLQIPVLTSCIVY